MTFASSCQETPESDDLVLPPIESVPLDTELDAQLVSRINSSPESAAAYLLRAFESVANEDVVTISELQIIANQNAAIARAKTVQSLLVFDENGDGQITKAEFQVVQPNNTSHIRFPGEYVFIRADKDENDILTMKEILLYGREFPSKASRFRSDWIGGFDENSDGRITKTEFLASVDKLIQEYGEPLSETKDNSKPGCSASLPAADDMVVFVSGYEGSGLSNVAVLSPDEVTEVSRLVIEEGDQPLYIMASTYESMIWVLTGDVDRVRKFVTSKNRRTEYGQNKDKAGVGVVGLAKEKIEFLEPNCLNYYYKPADSLEGIRAKGQWSRIAGRKPDKMIGHYALYSTRIPSGVNVPPNSQERFSKRTVSNLYRYAAEGVIGIDPEKVVAPAKVNLYDVLPQQGGLEQLLKSGHMKYLNDDTFHIVKPIARFPAGLAGGHSVKFVLGEGVPMPSGSPGHSTVYDEESGECLRGHRCNY